MTILQRAVQTLQRASTREPQRLPEGPASFLGLGSSITGTTSATAQQQLQAMDGSGWLFAVVDAISEAVSSTEWKLYRKRPNGERDEIKSHPLLDLWSQVNPFITQEDFVEASIQHFSLVGETFWVALPIKAERRSNPPTELQLLRPDRMAPIPDQDRYLKGWIYTIAAQRIPLEAEDVILTRRPHPYVPYRGISPIAAILQDVQIERNASRWVANFFKNGAIPGGIISFPDDIDEETLTKAQAQWRLAHQGTENAHRVAFIGSGAQWKDIRYTVRDIQLPLLRNLSRDIILGAYRVHPAILGISENVNRANAEAAELIFARWVVRPHLRRLRGTLNTRIAPLFEPGLEFEFEDPVPENRELALDESTRLYAGGIATQNESRGKVGLDDVSGGDSFMPAPAPFAARSLTSTRTLKAFEAPRDPDDNSLQPDTLNDQELFMGAAWERRLKNEMEELLEVLSAAAGSKMVTKIAIEDLEAHNWDWWHKYATEVVEELTVAFRLALREVWPTGAENQIQILAEEYARTRGGELLRVDGSANLAATTKDRVRQLTAQTIREGEGLGTLARNLRADVAFSKTRAMMVARTETAIALGQGGRTAALAEARDEKRWITQADERVEETCLGNEAMGWIPVDDVFASGHLTEPAHPRCMCRVIYRTKALHEELSVADLLEKRFRCPTCNKLLTRFVESGASYFCPRCKTERRAS